MRAANGVGLAAPQLGILQRIFVYDAGDGFQALINPKILQRKGEQIGVEGCLSLPGLQGDVARADEVVVKGVDQFGKPVRIRGDGLTARVIQHEMDHLDGVLFIDRADPASLHWVTAEEAADEEADGTDAADAGITCAFLFSARPRSPSPPCTGCCSRRSMRYWASSPSRTVRTGAAGRLSLSPVKDAALAAGLPLFQPEKVRAKEFVQTVRDLAPDVLVVAAFGQIIPQRMLDIPRFGGINVHGSLLPRWRGAAPMQYALMAGDAETGVTTMQMDAGLDTGDILLQAALPLDGRRNLGTLEPKLAELGADSAAGNA